ncbi:hypothetical protein DL768_011036 [Monosporascus sp. mg162]|nr:hypothetical protein DL768_011036 [Monosporascus sp. mg162]
MTVSRPPRSNHGSLPPSKGKAVVRQEARPMFSPASPECANGSSSVKSDRHVLQSGSQHLGDPEKVRDVSTDHSEPAAPLGANPDRQQSEIRWDASTTKSPIPPYPAQSSLSHDGLLPSNGGDVTGGDKLTQEERIQTLILCWENRKTLLNCPTTSIGGGEGHWKLMVDLMKAHVRPDLPSRLTKWSAVKKLVNVTICRYRRDRTSGRHPPPRRNESAVVHKLDLWTDRYNQILDLREVLVYGAKLFTALKRFLGASDIEDLIGDQMEESDSSMISPHLSICLPQVQEAIRHRHRQLEESVRGTQSGSAEICDGGDQCHISDNGSSSDVSIEASSGAAETGEALEETPNISRLASTMLCMASKEWRLMQRGLLKPSPLPRKADRRGAHPEPVQRF